MDVASSIGNGDRSCKQSTVSQPSLQLELKLPWSTEGESEAGNIYEAKSRGELDAEGATRASNVPCHDMKPSSSSSSHGMTAIAERGSRGCHKDSKGDGGRGRKKLRLSKEQSCYLEECFNEHTTLNPKQKLAVAKKLNLWPRQVEVWFQNRRARTKLKQTEVDFEYLKQWCKYLTEENRRLHKEIQELKAFQTPLQNVHHHKQPTMLATCPSCQHAVVLQKIGSFNATADRENCHRLACYGL